MFELIEKFATNFSEAIGIILALSIFALIQYLLNERQTNKLSKNHFHEVLDALKRIEEKLDRIDRGIVAIRTKLKIGNDE